MTTRSRIVHNITIRKPSAEAGAFLEEQDLPGRVRLDEDSDDGKEWQKERAKQQNAYNVDHAFGHAIRQTGNELAQLILAQVADRYFTREILLNQAIMIRGMPSSRALASNLSYSGV